MLTLIINGTTEVYVHSQHDMLSAYRLLKVKGLALDMSQVKLSPMQEFTFIDPIGYLEVAIADGPEQEEPTATSQQQMETNWRKIAEIFEKDDKEQEMKEKCEKTASVGSEPKDFYGFWMECDCEDSDHYVLPNGKSAPYGLTGVEVAAMVPKDMLYFVDLYRPCGYCQLAKSECAAALLLVAVERDLVFATAEKAKEAYNAMFGDLYGELE